MSKRNIIIAIIITMSLILGICISETIKYNKEQKQTQKEKINFSKEYSEVSEDNVFTYRNVDEIIKIMKNGTGVVYLGYPECPWCQAYVKYLNEVAKEVGIEKIYYCNTKKVKEENMDKYYKLVELLHGHLQYTDEGEEWIYVPNVSFHINGKIIGNDYETSKDTHNLKDPKEYWTEEEIKELKATLTKYMKEVYEKSNVCTDCNR